jgi:hypothetical protein
MGGSSSTELFYNNNNNNNNKIKNATDLWIQTVTLKNNPKKVSELFCHDGSLLGTVSRIKRTGRPAIKEYFEYFARKPGIKVLNAKYNISKVTDRVYINSAFVTWGWDGLYQPITARMTFVFRKNMSGNFCIFQLHSSALPDENENVR